MELRKWACNGFTCRSYTCQRPFNEPITGTIPQGDEGGREREGDKEKGENSYFSEYAILPGYKIHNLGQRFSPKKVSGHGVWQIQVTFIQPLTRHVKKSKQPRDYEARNISKEQTRRVKVTGKLLFYNLLHKWERRWKSGLTNDKMTWQCIKSRGPD